MYDVMTWIVKLIAFAIWATGVVHLVSRFCRNKLWRIMSKKFAIKVEIALYWSRKLLKIETKVLVVSVILFIVVGPLFW